VPTRGGLSISPRKTKGSHRTVPLDEDTAQALEEHRERQLAEAFGKLRKAAGLRAGRLHHTRHSHATLLLTGDAKAGIQATPLHVVSARLGHSSPMVTLSVYAHVLPTSDENAADAVGRAFASRLHTGL
jgi:integrase